MDESWVMDSSVICDVARSDEVEDANQEACIMDLFEQLMEQQTKTMDGIKIIHLTITKTHSKLKEMHAKVDIYNLQVIGLANTQLEEESESQKEKVVTKE
ncbi:hypothetical protein H5410_046482 [Solanum commersonii]|uniref:Uncharacterized protein n=1 Tax=Solanum commersonii TaxID=4109 RepID=A0A9J5XGL4_SOLCO|nr:hypothetical protein H5410_046482 [Solanum commersonii]